MTDPEAGTDWAKLIADAAAPDAPVRAVTFCEKMWGSAAKPALLKCDNGQLYVVKGHQHQRMLFNDHVVALLGAKIDVPVPTVRLVDVQAELIAAEDELTKAGFQPGIGHGSLWINPTSDNRQPISNCQLGQNRPRFARIAVLFGWAVAGDHQFIYATTQPELVFSHDHGHFFPNGPNWKKENLQGVNAARPDATVVQACAVTKEELLPALSTLDNVNEATIAAAIAAPPDSWGVAPDERVAIAVFLADRREQLLEHRDELQQEGAGNA